MFLHERMKLFTVLTFLSMIRFCMPFVRFNVYRVSTYCIFVTWTNIWDNLCDVLLERMKKSPITICKLDVTCTLSSKWIVSVKITVSYVASSIASLLSEAFLRNFEDDHPAWIILKFFCVRWFHEWWAVTIRSYVKENHWIRCGTLQMITSTLPSRTSLVLLRSWIFEKQTFCN